MFTRILISILAAFFVASSSADFMFDENKLPTKLDANLYNATSGGSSLMINEQSGGPYTYSQSAHHFYGTGYDGSYIDTTGCCSGQSGSCRNNPSCQCKVSVGPLPQGSYTLGNMMTFKGMPYCYELYPASSNSMCGRSGFLIHGGGCSGNPSEGCIVIESETTRYKIKSGASLKVIS